MSRISLSGLFQIFAFLLLSFILQVLFLIGLTFPTDGVFTCSTYGSGTGAISCSISSYLAQNIEGVFVINVLSFGIPTVVIWLVLLAIALLMERVRNRNQTSH